MTDLHEAILRWYDSAQRDLPWRRPDCSPWGVLVSEVMLQQTPVARVEPVWREWLSRWPTASDLAKEPPGEAVRAWGRLGYPRRALRLHAAATAIARDHDGVVPSSVAELRALPGIGDYTAAAVAAFAFGAQVAVVDTNVRRVQARLVTGVEHAAPALTAAERELANSLLPQHSVPKWGVAVMELGALVCTARGPACGRCPVADRCAWVRAGRPAYDGPPRRGQAWAGTDRQVRGRLLQVLRDSDGPVPHDALRAVWDEEVQRERCLDGLVADGLIEPVGANRYRLPG